MPFRSVGSRLALALLVIVVGVLAIVYVIVVPSYQRSLENQELRSLASSLQKVVLPQFPAEYDLRATYVNEMAPAVDARVAMYTEEAEEELLSGRPDFVLDAIDNIDTKVHLCFPAPAHRSAVRRQSLTLHDDLFSLHNPCSRFMCTGCAGVPHLK